ncbi:MAG: biotin--[acetyl-CoA-carboxylase] ligase [Spirochaetota bacterium]
MADTDFHILRFDELDSTSSYAVNNITSLPHNTVITADRQRAGRGRLGRTWVSDSPGNLYASVVIRPERDYRTLPLVNFTQFFSVIVADVLSGYGIGPVIKWPNDILVSGKKICGILSEVAFTGSVFNGIVVGIGLNIADNPSDKLDRVQETTSLFDQCRKTVSRKEVLDRILDRYLVSYGAFINDGFSSIYNSYMRYFPYLGEKITIINSNNNVIGIVRGITDSGELRVEDGSGTTHTITLGDMI